MNMLTVQEAARLWNVTEQTVRYHCRTGSIPGAQQDGKEWLIPDNANKPTRREAGAEQPMPPRLSPASMELRTAGSARMS